MKAILIDKKYPQVPAICIEISDATLSYVLPVIGEHGIINVPYEQTGDMVLWSVSDLRMVYARDRS